uniref:Ig-like domain-containing protein n=2 Tax=Oreochromis TaxID=8139 RepID=A0A669CKF4_ORENI
MLEEDFWTPLVVDSGRAHFLKETNISTLHVSNIKMSTLYICLVMNQQQCVSSTSLHVTTRTQMSINYYLEGETAVLQCPFSHDQTPIWSKSSKSFPKLDKNYSLVLPSVMLNDSGFYTCKGQRIKQEYWLIVCPKFGPSSVEVFSEGDEVNLTCSAKSGRFTKWFMKTNQTEGEIGHFDWFLKQKARITLSDDSLVISNVSLEDAGEYWCAGLESTYSDQFDL